MTELQLGTTPVRMPMSLTEGADFIATIKAPTGDTWPGTAVVSVKIGTLTWTATIASNEIRFNVDKAVVSTAITEAAKKYRLLYVDGAADLVWAEGPVVVHRA